MKKNFTEEKSLKAVDKYVLAGGKRENYKPRYKKMSWCFWDKARVKHSYSTKSEAIRKAIRSARADDREVIEVVCRYERKTARHDIWESSYIVLECFPDGVVRQFYGRSKTKRWNPACPRKQGRGNHAKYLKGYGKRNAPGLCYIKDNL